MKTYKSKFRPSELNPHCFPLLPARINRNFCRTDPPRRSPTWWGCSPGRICRRTAAGTTPFCKLKIIKRYFFIITHLAIRIAFCFSLTFKYHKFKFLMRRFTHYSIYYSIKHFVISFIHSLKFPTICLAIFKVVESKWKINFPFFVIIFSKFHSVITYA